MSDNAYSVAVQGLVLLPEFPHLALAHVSLALMGDDPDLNNGDLKSFLRWAFSVPGANGEWGCCTSWLKFLCEKRYPFGAVSRDWTTVRPHFPAADALIKKAIKETTQVKRISIFLDASTWGLRADAPSKRKLKASLYLGNNLLSHLDDMGFDVHFHYDAENDGKVQEPAVPSVDLYLGLTTVLSMGKVARIVTPESGSNFPIHVLLEELCNAGLTVFDGSVVTEKREAFPGDAKINLVLEFPINPRAADADVQAWAAEFSAIVTKAIIACDESLRQTT